MNTLEALRTGFDFLRQNPMFILQAARNAAHLELSVPLDVIRWVLSKRPVGKGPDRIDVSASPPAIGVGLTVDLYGTKLDVSANISVESVESATESLRVALRVRDLSLAAPPGTPAAMMVGSLDVKHPASLLKMMPMKHNALVEADDDRFVIDLLKIKPLASNPILRRILTVIDGAARIKEVRTEGDVLVIGFGVSPTAVPGALMRLRAGA